MIIARRPCLIFDVDLIGLAALLGLAAMAWFVAIRPQQQDARKLAQLALQLDQARLTLQQKRDQLRAVQDQTERLAGLLARGKRTEPPARSMAEHVSLVLAAAGRCGLDVIDFTPTDPSGDDPAGLTLRCRGTSRAFLEFLRTCARREPRHRIERFAIRVRGDGVCELECVMRFIKPTQPPEPSSDRSGDQP